MSIDNITVQEWNKMGFKTIKDRDTNELDNEPNHHPRFSEEAMLQSYDPVDKPEHYNTGGLECIDAIRGMLTHDEYIGYLRGNAMKYMWRFRYKKKPIEDLRKARWYEERLMQYMLENPSDK
jgi:hypothetical protein